MFVAREVPTIAARIKRKMVLFSIYWSDIRKIARTTRLMS